jgi:hypothetical protein
MMKRKISLTGKNTGIGRGKGKQMIVYSEWALFLLAAFSFEL